MDYRSRWYASGLGRFTQPDTIVPNPYNPQSLNRFTYTYNNPIRYTDPSGHCVGAGGDYCANYWSSYGNWYVDTTLKKDYGVVLTNDGEAEWTLAEKANAYVSVRDIDKQLKKNGSYKDGFKEAYGTGNGETIEIRRVNDNSLAGYTDPADRHNGNVILFGNAVEVNGGLVNKYLFTHELGHSLDFKRGISDGFNDFLTGPEGRGLSGYDLNGVAMRHYLFKGGEDAHNETWFEDPEDRSFLTGSGIWPDVFVAFIYSENWADTDEARAVQSWLQTDAFK